MIKSVSYVKDVFISRGSGILDFEAELREMMYRHRWTRNIMPPSTPKCYDPNEPPFNPADILGEADEDGLDEE
jgi:hypothetical protein